VVIAIVMNKAVFLDKDGTLVKNVPYNIDEQKIVLLPRVGEGLELLSSLGYKLIIISNQSGIARGYFEEEALQKVYQKLQELIAPYGVSFDGFYYCPHHPESTIAQYKKKCLCRKPLPGLFYQASKRYFIDLSKSFVIGDILDDCEAGRRVGCQTILIDNGNETEWQLEIERTPHNIASNFLEAAEMIRNQTKKDNHYAYYE
jgi:D-glycero-D-manno-heptose 1,7-bisphosphate phosphatase